MRRFVLELFLVLFCFICFDLLIGYLGSYLTVKEPISDTDVEKVALFDAEADIIILGSSRANHHYDPKILSETFNLTVYNAGRDGKDILYSYCVLSSMIERHVPQFVILDLGYGQLDGRWQERFNSNLRFYNLIPSVKEVSDNIFPLKEKWKLFMNTYRYNGQLLSMINAYMSPTSISDGYLPLNGVFDGDFNEENLRENSQEVRMPSYYDTILKRMIELCRRNKVELFVVYSPCIINNYQNIPHFLEEYCRSNGLVYFNYDNIDKYSSFELYKDEYHMNQYGASVFTKDLCDDISLYLENSI